MKKTWISGAWEVTTSGNIDQGSIISFTVRHQKWERLAFKCVALVNIIRKGDSIETKLIHKKILPQFVKLAINNMTFEVLKDNGVSVDLVSA